MIKGVSTVAFIDDAQQGVLDVLATMARTVLEPWGGAEACVDAYESAIRATTDAQFDAAREISLEPVRAFVATCANLTRDIGAAQLSSVRWLLDV
jgi:hypothetical protein